MSLPMDQRPHDPDYYCPADSKQTKERCGNKAGHDTEHLGHGLCSFHGGNSPGGRVQGARLAAKAACAALGVPIATSGVEALLDELARARGNVAFYELLVQELPTHPGPDVWIEFSDEDETPDADGKGHWRRGETGIYGPTYHVSGLPTGEAKPHVLLSLYNDERKHYLQVAAAVVKANVDERRVELAESVASRDGAEIAQRFRTLITALGLSLDDPKVQSAARLALSNPETIDGTADDDDDDDDGAAGALVAA